MMTRSQALAIGILIGLIVLVCIGLLVVVVWPYQHALPPPATAALPLAPILTPTLPNFLPTANIDTPLPPEPTVTNTRLPTATPTLPQPPTATIVPKLPTLYHRPTSTPKPVTAAPVLVATPSPTLTPVPASRQYAISFEAQESTLIKGKCTDLRWQVAGAAKVTLNGETVAATGKQKVCPQQETSYQLIVYLPGDTQFIRRSVTITVEEEKKETK
jgi:hypothetical protein